MSGPSTAVEFLDLVKQSQLLSDGVLKQYAPTDASESRTAQEVAKAMVQAGHLTVFQANHILRGRYKNFFIGKYKVLMPIGSGGASHVFLCEHSVMKHRVAIKLLHTKESNDPGSLDRFLREARAAATVNHPNVVRAYDIDKSEDKYHYIVMDFVDGVSLHDLVAKHGPLSCEQATQFISQAATGLQHIGEMGLVHRDIKPSNLMLDRTGLVRILDLGLARSMEKSDDNVTAMYKDRTIHGTADYLSPEQALQANDLDIRSDIYSLGATLYFLLAGRPAFDNMTIAQKLLHHQFKEIPRIPDVPDDLWEVVRTMMAKKPEDRYQSPDEVLAALQEWTAIPLPPPDDAFFVHAKTAPPPPSTARRSAITSSRVTPSRIEGTNRVPAPPPATNTLLYAFGGIIVALLAVIAYLLLR